MSRAASTPLRAVSGCVYHVGEDFLSVKGVTHDLSGYRGQLFHVGMLMTRNVLWFQCGLRVLVNSALVELSECGLPRVDDWVVRGELTCLQCITHLAREDTRP